MVEVPPEHCDIEVVQNVLQEQVELPFHVLVVPAVLFSLLSASLLSLKGYQTFVTFIESIMDCGVVEEAQVWIKPFH